MYFIRTVEAGQAVAHHFSQGRQFGRARAKKAMHHASRLAVREYNRRLARRNLTNILNANFLPGDGHVRLHYWTENKPTAVQAMHLWDVFTKAVRRACAKAGIPFRFVHALGLGERGAMHHHVVVNKDACGIVARLWKHGAKHIDPLYDWQNYQGLAWYFCGQDKNENPEDKKLWEIWGKGYSCSRGLVRPPEKTETVDADEWEKYPDPGPGRLVDINSLDVGESPVTGREYLYFITLPLPAPPWRMSAARREEWAEQEQAKNAALVKWKIDKLHRQLEERRKAWALERGEAC